MKAKLRAGLQHQAHRNPVNARQTRASESITTRPRNRLDGRHHSTQTRTTNHTPNSTKNTASGNSSDIASTGNTSLHHTHNRAQLSIPISRPANHKQHLKWNARNSGTETAHTHQRQTRYLTAGRHSQKQRESIRQRNGTKPFKQHQLELHGTQHRITEPMLMTRKPIADRPAECCHDNSDLTFIRMESSRGRPTPTQKVIRKIQNTSE